MGTRSTFLTHVGMKSQWCWRGNYVKRVIKLPTLSIPTRDWHCDGDITFC